MVSLFKELFNDRRGVTAIEYGLVAGFIAVLIVAGARAIGTGLSTIYGSIGTSI